MKRPLRILSRLSGKAVLLLTACFTFGFSGPEIDEYQVKAMFLINFIKHVDWSSHKSENTIRIGVVGKSEIISALEKIAEFKKGNTKPLEIIQVEPGNLPVCNIIFIPDAESGRLAQLAKDLAGKGVLLVSEDNKSTSHLAGINLIKEDNKIKFEINQAAIKQSGLRLSSQLQLLAYALNP